MVSQSSSEPTWLTVVRLLRWDKPAGRLILMIPALWGLFLGARSNPPLPLVIVIIVGTLATSAAGCVVNDLWDRDIDPQVERTRTRPLAARALSVTTGLIITFIAFVCAAVLAFYLHPLTFWLSVAAVPVIILYPLAKRFFPIPQLVLSLAWGFAVLISWTAVTGKLETDTWWLWGATVAWTLGFDTVYALADVEDDTRLGVNSSARFFGPFSPVAIGIFFLITAGCLAYLGWSLGLGWLYWLSLTVSILVWGWQTYRLQFSTGDKSLSGAIFRENVWLGFILLAGMITGF